MKFRTEQGGEGRGCVLRGAGVLGATVCSLLPVPQAWENVSSGRNTVTGNKLSKLYSADLVL